jgi:hypothetical protein
MFHGSEVAHFGGPGLPDRRAERGAEAAGDDRGARVDRERLQRFYTVAACGRRRRRTRRLGGQYVPLFYGWQDNPFNALRS